MASVWNQRKRPLRAALVGGALLLAGCGGGPENIGRVSGKVTLAGQPLPDATVVFTPAGPGGSSSAGRTDRGGNYTLSYSRSTPGAMVGKHYVSIKTFDLGDPDGDPPRPSLPEKVPARYNVQSELTAEVVAGRNTHNFDLDASGPIAPPPTATLEE